MPAPGAPKGMGGMSSPGGEVPDEIAQMMGGGVSGASGGSSGSGANPLAGMGGNKSGGKMSPAKMAAAQQAMGQGGGGLPGADGQTQQPREVGTIKDELKRGARDFFKGIKEFFKLNTWLGIDANKMDPEQQVHAKKLHSRYKQLDQEQQMVARKMYEEKMQKQKAEQEEEHRKKQIAAQKKAQSMEVPSGPQKGAKGQGGSGKQRAKAKLQQDRTTLSTTQGE